MCYAHSDSSLSVKATGLVNEGTTNLVIGEAIQSSVHAEPHTVGSNDREHEHQGEECFKRGLSSQSK